MSNCEEKCTLKTDSQKDNEDKTIRLVGIEKMISPNRKDDDS